MNAQTPTPSALTVVAVQNADILSAFRDGPLPDLKAVAAASGRDSKNLSRQVELMHRDGLVTASKPYDLTEAGRRALVAIDLAEGRIDPAAGGEASDILLVAHHHLRPNRAQPRKHIDDQELEELAATIHEAGDVLQNLVVFPADEDGAHDIAAGERRWRAVGLLIERGLWSPDRRLRALQRDRSAGQVSYLALVENQQRASLTLMEQARAYAELINETGWSAREAALKTGRDPRTVQEMQKVLREASPEDIARHEEDPAEFTWEKLRNSVKAPQPAEPEQIDIEDDHAAWVRRKVTAGCEALNPKQLMVLVEIADKVDREPDTQHEGYTACYGAYPDPTHAAQHLVDNCGLGFLSGGDIKGELLHLNAATLEWLSDNGLRTSEGDRESILSRVRPGVQPGDAAGRYRTPWLNAADAQSDPLVVNGVRFPNLTRANEARRLISGGGPVNNGGGKRTEPQQPAPAMRDLDSHEWLAMLELAARLEDSQGTYIAVVSGWTWAPVRKYWLDKTCSQLASDLRLIELSHTFPGGPHATFTPAGQAWLQAQLGDAQVSAQDLEEARRAAGHPDWPGEGAWVTPWLNVPEEAAPAAIEQDGAKSNDDLDEEEHAEALARLDVISDALDHADDFDRPALFARAGVEFPLRAGAGSELGVIFDGKNRALLTIDSDGHLPADDVRARVLLVIATLNAAVAEWEVPPGVPPDAREPAVPIRLSVTADHIVCLEDGRKFKSLTRHLRTKYNLSPDQYRARWNLPADYPMVAPAYAQARYELARSMGMQIARPVEPTPLPDAEEDE